MSRRPDAFFTALTDRPHPLILLVALVTSAACSSDSRHAAAAADPDGGTGATSGGGAGGNGSGATGSGATGNGGSGGGDAGGSGATGSGGTGSGGIPGLPYVPGQPDTSVQTALPPLPAMTNVTGAAFHDNVSIRFDPVDGARDYRVYVLPKDADVSSDDAGHVTVKNAIYRCAGDRQAPPATLDGADQVSSGAVKTLVDGQDVGGVTRQLADATLGHVYVTAGAGRVPVYAMGNPDPDGDNSCYFQRWGASRDKRYVTSADERAKLLSERWRDDGIAFYVPEAAGGDTRAVHTTFQGGARYYYVDGAETQERGAGQTAFRVLTSGSDETRPLMRVFYSNFCGISHDELVAGQARFDRARYQGDQQPVFELRWSGITAETTLVVEALADGCPADGFLGPDSRPEFTNQYGDVLPAWQTVGDLGAASPTGEVYINGQHDPGVSPRPIARTFLKVSPGPVPELDWFQGFSEGTDLGPWTDEDCGNPLGCGQQFRSASTIGDLEFLMVETDRWGIGTALGQLLPQYADVAADVNGKFRLTPTTKGTMSADTFLHATMTVDAFSTARRYPQIIISDQDVPVQWNIEKGNTLVVQTFGDWPIQYQLEVCDHRPWDVNNQCPAYDMYHVVDPNDPTNVVGLAPNAEVGEHIGMDKGTRFDVYVSTKRAYLFLDGEPYGCADLPASGVPSGPVTVTFGDVLYHSGVDNTFAYTSKHLQIEMRRHFDNLGFKSGEVAPPWDEARMPCVTDFPP